jgi:4-amino-4-deoxychorismate lyase
MDNRPLLIESICIKDQKIQLLEYHNQRANDARCELYNIGELLNFNNIIDVKEAKSPIVKCRIVYGESIKSIEYQPYKLKPIDSLKIIEIDDGWDYKYKYLDRSKLDHYFNQRGKADDMIMIRKGFVTDSYYGNVAFLKKDIWYTPAHPLLKGTRRARLIDNAQIVERKIPRNEILSYNSIRIFNAMIPFGQIEISINSID